MATLPAVALARDNFPGHRILFLTATENAAMVRGFSEVDDVLVLDRQAFRQGRWVAGVRNILQLVRWTRRENLSHVLDFQGYGETAILTWLTGAPNRWGLINRTSRRWAFTKPIERDYGIHLADANLALGLGAGLRPGPIRNEFRVPKSDMDTARSFFRERNSIRAGQRCSSTRSRVRRRKTGRWSGICNWPNCGARAGGR